MIEGVYGNTRPPACCKGASTGLPEKKLLGILNLTRQSSTLPGPENATRVAENAAPPPIGKLRLRNEDISAEGLDKLFNAPANLLAVPMPFTTADPTDCAVLAIVLTVEPTSNNAIMDSLVYIFS